MSDRLSGRVCIITGTGGGMGREAALTFAREGALVVGCDLQVDAAQATVEVVRIAGSYSDVPARAITLSGWRSTPTSFVTAKSSKTPS